VASAQVRKVTKTREKIVEEVYTEIDGVTLQLNKEEAALLTAILYTRVTGSGPLRKLSDGISTALDKAGFASKDNADTREAISKMDGYVHLQGINW